MEQQPSKQDAPHNDNHYRTHIIIDTGQHRKDSNPYQLDRCCRDDIIAGLLFFRCRHLRHLYS